MSVGQVWYIELCGDGAQARLEEVLRVLEREPGFAGAELQVSPAQPGLALLASRWRDRAPEKKPLPAEAKAWAFEVIAVSSVSGE